MSICNIPFLTSFLEPLHRFDSDFVWMFIGWTPTKFVKIGVLPLFFHGIMGKFVQFWANSYKFFFYKTTDQKSFIFGLENPQGT